MKPLNEDGDVSFEAINLTKSRIENFMLTPGVVSTEGFALQSFAAKFMGGSNGWSRVADFSRLAHPSDFDINHDITIPVG